MAYGVQLQGFFGLVSIDDVRIPVLRATYPVSGTSGSFGIPTDVTVSNAIAYASVPNINITISGSTLTWSVVQGSGLSFNIILLRF